MRKCVVVFLSSSESGAPCVRRCIVRTSITLLFIVQFRRGLQRFFHKGFLFQTHYTVLTSVARWHHNFREIAVFVPQTPYQGSDRRSPCRGFGGRSPQKLKYFRSSFKQILRIFGSNSHTIHEIETLIIENENYEAQLQSANSAPIRTTFIQRMKKGVKHLRTPNVHYIEKLHTVYLDLYKPML